MVKLLHSVSVVLLVTTLIYGQTGVPSPSMQSCDIAVNEFIGRYGIPGASLAITYQGRLIYHRGFGKADLAGTTPVNPYHRFRIASVSKPITAIAIMKLVEDGALALNDKVFGPQGILRGHARFKDAVVEDDRIFDITIQHLLEHTAGWDRSLDCFPSPTLPYPYSFSGCDPIVAPLYVAETLGVANPISEVDLVQFMIEKGLDFAPGTRYAYSNMGYLVLGEVIEMVADQSYETYVQNEIFGAAGACDAALGYNLRTDRLPREVEYTGNGFTNLSVDNSGVQVPWEYGGFHLEAMSAHGGWVTSSLDLVKLLTAVDGFSSKPDILSAQTIATMTAPSSKNNFYAKGWSVNPANNWWHTGSLDGTASFIARTSNEFTFALLLNKRIIDGQADNFWADLDALPWGCISATSSYPTYDLSLVPTVASSKLEASSVAGNSLKLSWTGGNGTGRILVGTQGASIDGFPVEGMEYKAMGSFGEGDDLGENTYVLYRGNGISQELTDLEPDTDYTFQLFEYRQDAATGNHILYRVCGNAPITVRTSVATSIDRLASLGISVYPRITNAGLEVSLPADLRGVSYELLTAAGQSVRSGKFSGTLNPIDLTAEARGLYVLRLRMAQGKVGYAKIIKQ